MCSSPSRRSQESLVLTQSLLSTVFGFCSCGSRNNALHAKFADNSSPLVPTIDVSVGAYDDRCGAAIAAGDCSRRVMRGNLRIQSVDWLSLTNQLCQSVIGARNDREEQQNWSRQATLDKFKIRMHLDLLSIPRLGGEKCQNV